MPMDPPSRPADAACPIVPDTPEARAYVAGILARGEAARPGPDGRLPPGATHEIVGEDRHSGLPILIRRRIN